MVPLAVETALNCLFMYMCLPGISSDSCTTLGALHKGEAPSGYGQTSGSPSLACDRACPAAQKTLYSTQPQHMASAPCPARLCCRPRSRAQLEIVLSKSSQCDAILAAERERQEAASAARKQEAAGGSSQVADGPAHNPGRHPMPWWQPL